MIKSKNIMSAFFIFKFVIAATAIVFFGAIVSISAATAATIADGDLIRNPTAIGAAQFDIYIVKIIGAKKFKRLILNPKVFESYGHLKWNNIKFVSQVEIDSYVTSSLARVEKDTKVYVLIPNNDSGSKRWVNISGSDFVVASGDPDSVYTINTVDAHNYNTQSDIADIAELKIFLAGKNTPISDLDYAVKPIIFLAADTVIDVDSYRIQVDASFNEVRDWYYRQLEGKTFILQPALVYRSGLSSRQLHDKYGAGTGIWIQGLKEAALENKFDICNDRRFYYFVTPVDDISGGMVGAENLGCSYVLPGTASISTHMGRLIGGVVDPNWQEWWADEITESQGGVAHEIGHGLGGSCKISNTPTGQCDGLPHADWNTDSIMIKWWDFGKSGNFTDEERKKILKSPFIN